MPYRAPTLRPSHAKARTPDNRQHSAARGYDHAWRKLRERLIKADPAKWLRCEACGEYATDTSRIQLDHITPISEGGARLDPANLRPLCPSCHSKRTIANSRGDSDSVENSALGIGRGGVISNDFMRYDRGGPVKIFLTEPK